jgi:hypothetical protein
MRGGLLRRNSIQQRKHRWSMPRFTIECASKLISNAIHFSHCHCLTVPSAVAPGQLNEKT